MFKRYLLYTGLKATKPFIVMIEEPLTTSHVFTGTVVATHKKCSRYVGEWSNRWSNPVADLLSGSIPDFTIIHHEEFTRLSEKWDA